MFDSCLSSDMRSRSITHDQASEKDEAIALRRVSNGRLDDQTILDFLEEFARLLLLYDADAVSHREQNHLDPWIDGNGSVEGANSDNALIVAGRVGYSATLKHVVQQDESARTQTQEHFLVVVGVSGLISVNECEVEQLVGRQGTEDVDSWSDAQLDFVAYSRPLPRPRAMTPQSSLTSQQRRCPSGPSPLAIASAEYPVKVPISIARFTPMARTNISIRTAWSSPICIPAACPVFSRVTFCSVRWSSSGSVKYAADSRRLSDQ